MSWPMRSASSTRTSGPASARATVLLPLPAGPTMPNTNGVPALAGRRGRALEAPRSVDIEPGVPRPHRNGERHPQGVATFHLALDERDHVRGVGLRALEQQLVVDLQQQPRAL